MTNFFKTIIFFIVFFAIGITLFNVFDLTKNNTNLKTDNEILMEQVAEYENNLTLTRAELIIAQEEREELVTTVINYQTEVTELKSQAVIDTEALATAEANLATAEQALEEKDAEIAELKQDLETFELICGIANLDVATAIKPSDFDYTYETFNNAYPTELTLNTTSWGYGTLSGQVGLDSVEYVFPSFQVSAIRYNSTAVHSFADAFQYLYDFNNFIVDKGIYIASISMPFHYTSNTTGTIQTAYNAYDFVSQVDDRTINANNWVDFFINGNYLSETFANYLSEKISSGTFTYTQNSVNSLSFHAYYPRSMADEISEITTVNLDGSNYNITTNYVFYSMNLVLNEKIDIDKICLFADSYNIVIDNSFKSVCLADYYLSEAVINANFSNLSFTENGYIEKLYLPRDIDIANMRDDFKSHIGEVVFLPFTQMQMEYITMSLMQ